MVAVVVMTLFGSAVERVSEDVVVAADGADLAVFVVESVAFSILDAANLVCGEMTGSVFARAVGFL